VSDADAAEAAGDEEQPEPDVGREQVLADIAEALGDAVLEHRLVPHRDLWVRVDRSQWQSAGRALKEDGFTYFGFLSVIDWMDAPDGRYETTEFDDAGSVPSDADADDAAAGDGADGDGAGSGGDGPVERSAGGSTRFQVFARVQKPGTALGVTLKADLPDDDLRVDSWVGVFTGANWHEREAHEMFGVQFDGHPYLRHIYLPTEFEGHPLRKDFPLLARVVKPWPGVVDIEEIPENLEQQLEDEVMAAFAAEQGEGEGAS
jgi:NADH-quinone oxidoreductase subunit C